MSVQVKRIYEPHSSGDGYRILVDRLWPRGIRKDAELVDLWLKKVAPSTELRKWFQHDPQRWDAFKLHYYKELDKNEGNLQPLLSAIQEHDVTLLYSARDKQHNQAVALLDYILSRWNE